MVEKSQINQSLGPGDGTLRNIRIRVVDCDLTDTICHHN